VENAQRNEQPAVPQGPDRHLWVLEGVMDAPIVLPRPETGPSQGKDVRGFSIDFGNGDGDGFVEMHAVDVARANNSVWWSKDEPVLFDFRCSVVAAEPFVAWLRANDFLEQVLDRLTVLAGVPVTLVSLSSLYNETELIECKAGTRSSFRFQVGGRPTSKTGPVRNLHLLQHLRPSDRAKLAMRWFRKALTFDREEDQFLAFFVALEVISDDIKAPALVQPTCKNCGAEVNSFTSHLEGVKEVIRQHSEMPKRVFDRLRKVRGKIAHGELSHPLTAEVRDYLPFIERLAAEAIAISLGADPKTVQVRGGIRMYEGVIVGQVDFTPDQNPHMRWKRSIREALETLRRLARG
jgi:hypothetical protein